MRAWIDRDRVRPAERVAALQPWSQPAPELQHGDDTILSRGVRALQPGVERQHIDVPGSIDVTEWRERIGVEKEQAPIS